MSMSHIVTKHVMTRFAREPYLMVAELTLIPCFTNPEPIRLMRQWHSSLAARTYGLNHLPYHLRIQGHRVLAWLRAKWFS